MDEKNKIGFVDAPTSKKIKHSFFKSDLKTVGNFVFYEKFIPAFKMAISEVIKSATDMFIYGKDYKDNRQVTSIFNGATMNAISYWNRKPKRVEDNLYSKFVSSRDLKCIGGFTEYQARSIREQIDQVISTYGEIRMSDVYGLINQYISDPGEKIQINSPDANYGWNTSRGIDIYPSGGAWVLELPPPIQLS